MYLLDTVAASETAKARPNEGLISWLRAAPARGVYMSVLSIGEMVAGIERLPAGARRARLENWMRDLVGRTMRGRILPIDEAVAQTWGRIEARAPKTIPPVDALIAATAIARGLAVVTRNVRHFEAAGVQVVDPWA